MRDFSSLISCLQWMAFGNEPGLDLRSLLASPLAGVYEEFAEGAGDDARVGSGGTPRLARQVLHSHFSIGATSAFKTGTAIRR